MDTHMVAPYARMCRAPLLPPGQVPYKAPSGMHMQMWARYVCASCSSHLVRRQVVCCHAVLNIEELQAGDGPLGVLCARDVRLRAQRQVGGWVGVGGTPARAVVVCSSDH